MQFTRRTFASTAAASFLICQSASAGRPSKRAIATESRFETRSGGTLKILSNYFPLSINIDHVVICIHGIHRDHANYFSYITEAMAMAGSQALCVAPCFPKAAEKSTDLFWSDGSWNSGGKDDSAYNYSGFSAIDELIATLQAKQVTIVGHSGGGQFAHRYGLASVCSQPMRIIVTNPSSYTYLSAERPIRHQYGYFVPSLDGYDAYRYGLSSHLNTYLKQTPVDRLRNQYLERRVTYLLGDADTDTNSSTLDRTEQASLQGAHRYERGWRYFQYLNDCFPSHRHAKVVVPGVGHSAKSMFQSSIGRKAIFTVA